MYGFVRLFVVISMLAVLIIHSATADEKSALNKRSEQQFPVPPAQRDVPGKHFDLSLGTLFVPDFFNPDLSVATEVVVFFHGASWCSEQTFYDAFKNAVIVSITVKNYGYPLVFNDPEKFLQVLEETTTTLVREKITTKPIGKVCLTSFSGGYSAIREILRLPQFENLISDVVLADSLYAPRVEGRENELEPAAMEPFVRFARRAVKGECSMWFTHLFPPLEEHRGNTTTLAADYLLNDLGLVRIPAFDCNTRGARLLYRTEKGNFHLLGYAGMTTQDHFEHFYALSDLFRKTSLTAAKPNGRLDGFDISPHWNEQVKTYSFEPDVRVVINAPSVESFDPSRPTKLIFFALPNGNTIEQTIGKKVVEGVDWHFGIQHIGAQTRRLRQVIKDWNIVVAYLEAGGKSWPTWRRTHPDETELIKRLIDSVREHFPWSNVKIHLSAHSGGGSLIFGYLNGFDELPSEIERISFLDANYGYDDDEKHGDTLIPWLLRCPNHHLNVICYDDRNIRVNGKLVVGPTGGTYRKTLKMVRRLLEDIHLARRDEKDLIRYRGLNDQVDIILHKNPENKILHTVLVGDMNGFIHAVTSGTEYENRAAEFNGPLAYEEWIQP